MDVFDVRGRPEEVAGVMRAPRGLVLDVGGCVRHRSFDGDTGRVLAVASGVDCTCHRVMRKARIMAVDECVQKHFCFSGNPITYCEGWEHHRVLAFDGSQLKKLFKTLDSMGENHIILRKRLNGEVAQDIFPISLSSLLAGLTRKQLQVLVEDLDNGYYRVPRGITVAQLAEAKCVPRTTFEEHLQKGESKVLRSMAPFLKMYFEG